MSVDSPGARVLNHRLLQVLGNGVELLLLLRQHRLHVGLLAGHVRPHSSLQVVKLAQGLRHPVLLRVQLADEVVRGSLPVVVHLLHQVALLLDLGLHLLQRLAVGVAELLALQPQVLQALGKLHVEAIGARLDPLEVTIEIHKLVVDLLHPRVDRQRRGNARIVHALEICPNLNVVRLNVLVDEDPGIRHVQTDCGSDPRLDDLLADGGIDPRIDDILVGLRCDRDIDPRINVLEVLGLEVGRGRNRDGRHGVFRKLT